MSDVTTDRLLTIRQLAAKWGWHASKLYRLVAARHIPYLRVPGEKGRGTIRFRESELDAWLDAIAVPAKIEARVPAASPRVMVDRAAECERLGIPVDHRFT
jgi:excisionase family DNA binding protein